MRQSTFLGIVLLWMTAVLVTGGFEYGVFWGVLSHLSFGALASWYGYRRGVEEWELFLMVEGSQ